MDVGERVVGAVNRLISARAGQSGDPLGIQILCLLTITTICVIWVLLKLAPVLVPLTFAIFLAFLVEPVLAAFVLFPQNCVALWRRARRRCAAKRASSRPSPAPATVGGAASAGGRRDGAVTPVDDTGGDVDLAAVEGGGSDGTGASHRELRKPCCYRLKVWLYGVWDIVAILLCVLLMFGIAYGVVVGIVEALTSFNWGAYQKSPRVEEIVRMLKSVGINTTQVLSGSVLEQYRGEVVDVALKAVGVLEAVLLTLLLFFFALVAMLPGVHQRLKRSRMKSMMQRYLLCKTIASIIIAGAVALSLWVMEVPLVPIWGIITFTLNFIPNIGSFFAILAPIPLVALDPHKNFMDVVMVAVVPFLIHNALGNIIEPKLMSQGLDLHPLTVVLALTFWGSVWGIAGAILSVPITCAIRLWLEEIDHPYAKTLHKLFDEPMHTSFVGEEPGGMSRPSGTLVSGIEPSPQFSGETDPTAPPLAASPSPPSAGVPLVGTSAEAAVLQPDPVLGTEAV